MVAPTQDDKPARCEIEPENIPQELLERKQWVVWRWELRDGKWTKPPYNPTNNSKAKSDDPRTWTDFKTAFDTVHSNGHQYDGVGFMVTPPYVGVDFDGCRDRYSGEIDPKTRHYLERLDSYSEISPSGRGIKTLTRAKLLKGHHDRNVGVFADGRYFCITGQVIGGVSQDIQDRQVVINEIVRERWPEDFEKRTEAEQVKVDDSLDLWDTVKRIFSNYPRIMRHLITPNREDRSAHDWKLACLCLEEGITNPQTLYHVICNNPYGKAKSYPDTKKYIETLISKCLAQFGTEIPKKTMFPTHAIGGLAKEFADLYSSYLESPRSFFIFNFLTCLGSIISDRVTLQSEIAPQPRLYTVNIGESADDRKSESIKKTVSFFENALAQGSFKVCHGVGSAEGLARRLGESNEPAKKMLLIYDELKSFVGKAQIEGATLLPAVNSFFEGNRFHSATKTHVVEINDAFISLLGASTLDTFSRMWSPSFLDIGFLNRLWLVRGHGERRFSIPKEIPQAEIRALHQRLGNLLKKFPHTIKMPVSEKAQAVFDEWYFKVESSEFARRLDTLGLRLMILLTVNRGDTEVSEDTAQRVVELLEWQLKVRREVNPIDAESSIAKMEQIIRRALAEGPLSKRELQRRVNYQRAGLFIWGTAIKNLQSAGEITFDYKKEMYMASRR